MEQFLNHWLNSSLKPQVPVHMENVLEHRFSSTEVSAYPSCMSLCNSINITEIFCYTMVSPTEIFCYTI